MALDLSGLGAFEDATGRVIAEAEGTGITASVSVEEKADFRSGIEVIVGGV